MLRIWQGCDSYGIYGSSWEDVIPHFAERDTFVAWIVIKKLILEDFAGKWFDLRLVWSKIIDRSANYNPWAKFSSPYFCVAHELRMFFSTLKHWRYRHRKQTYGCQGRVRGVINKFGISRYKLIYRMDKQQGPIVQHRNYIQYPVINHKEKNIKECICKQPSMYSRK